MSATERERWRLVRQPSGEVESDLFDIETAKAYNRYASHFVAKMDDPGNGEKAALYPRGQRATAEVSTDGGDTWTVRQAGFVQRPDDGNNLGTGQFEALFIGYDHFLRREPVYTTFDGVTILSALQTIVQNFTPVEWVPGNVTVSNNATISREFVGEKADEVISWLASASGNEEYGVNKDFEFFFEPRETTSAPSNLPNGDWFAYDLPTEGRHAVNAVQVFYGDNSTSPRSSVIVEDRVTQRDLRESLDASRRVVLGDDVHYPEIDNRDAARIKGQEILNQKSPVLTGTVETFQRFDWEPGDVFRLTIPEKGIDTGFAVAEIQHSWTGATTLKVAQNTDNVGDLLMAMSDDIVRVDLRDSDADAAYTRYLDLNLGVTVTVTGSLSQVVVDDDAFLAGFGPIGDTAGFVQTQTVNAGLNQSLQQADVGTGAVTNAAANQFRDVWQGETPDPITTWEVGTGTTAPNRSNTALDASVGGDVVTEVLPDGSNDIVFVGTIPPGGAFQGTNISEYGFFDSGGEMHNRLVLSESVNHGATTETRLRVRFSVDDDAEQVGVVTEQGQTRIRDMYLNEVAPATYATSHRAYGTGTTPEVEANTALGAKLGEKALTHEDSGTGLDIATMELLNAEANGNSLAELGDENTVNELLTRVTFEPLPKTSDFALVSNLGLNVRPVVL